MLDSYGLHMRAAFFRSIRQFFYEQGFLEVDTPLRQPVLIPESNIVPIMAGSQFLHTSPELSMKRILTTVDDNIFQLCPCFREGEKGRMHLEEFWMLEWYRHDADYVDLMRDCFDVINAVSTGLQEAQKKLGGETVIFAGLDICDWARWQKLSVAEGFSQYSPVSLSQALESNSFDQILVEYVEPHLGWGTPLFFYDYPVKLGSLARTSKKNPSIAERFELYMNGVEIANGFSELTDSQEQKARFESERRDITSQGRDAGPMPERFLADIEKLDRVAGIALGVDRLFMLAMNKTELGCVRPFQDSDFV